MDRLWLDFDGVYADKAEAIVAVGKEGDEDYRYEQFQVSKDELLRIQARLQQALDEMDFMYVKEED